MIQKEFNKEAYQLRYAGCWAPYLSQKDGKVVQLLSNNIGNHSERFDVQTVDGESFRTTFDYHHPMYMSLEPGYYPLKHLNLPGMVKGKIKASHLCIRRRMVKTFRQAYSCENYMQFAAGVSKAALDFCYPVFIDSNGAALRPHELCVDIEKAIEDEGLIDDKFYLTKDSLFFLDTLAGMRSKNKLLVKKNYYHEVAECLSMTKLVVKVL